VARYLQAVNTHDLGSLCAGFTGRTPVACGGSGPHLPEQPLLRGPAFARLVVEELPAVRRHGRTAEADVQVVVITEPGGRDELRETLHLRRAQGRWTVTEPSPVFFRALNRQAP
jgi:hypothetical protein